MAVTAKFTQFGNIVLAIDGKEYFVPDNMDNTDRQFIANWVAEGNVIEPYVAPVIDLSALDTSELNAALIAEGSVLRAVGLVMFAEVNKLRVKTGDPAYTLTQFKAALKAQMR